MLEIHSIQHCVNLQFSRSRLPMLNRCASQPFRSVARRASRLTDSLTERPANRDCDWFSIDWLASDWKIASNERLTGKSLAWLWLAIVNCDRSRVTFDARKIRVTKSRDFRKQRMGLSDKYVNNRRYKKC